MLRRVKVQGSGPKIEIDVEIHQQIRTDQCGDTRRQFSFRQVQQAGIRGDVATEPNLPGDNKMIDAFSMEVDFPPDNGP